VRVWPATEEAAQDVLREAEAADVVVKASGVGVFDRELLDGVLRHAAPHAVRVFLDVDAPATLAAMRAHDDHPVRRALPHFDLVVTYGGGPPVVESYMWFGARNCVPVYNALDPDTHFPVPLDPAYVADLSLLANRLPDREARIEEFFLRPARLLPGKRFLLGGNGWDDKPVTPNLRAIGHVPTALHNALNCSALAVLNVARDSMAATGYSPATRVFEAAGAGACIITDAWEGIDLFLEPGREILVARDGADVADLLAELTPQQARAVGEAARTRILGDHTYAQRAVLLDTLLRDAAEKRKQEIMV
jgi:spore maturation protein CgeB